MLTGLLAGIAAKLGSMGVAAKASVGLGIATAATATVATVVPVEVPDARGGTVPPAEVSVPAQAEAGLAVASNALSGQLDVGAETGLDIAARTPAADKLPTIVAPPSSVPPVSVPAVPPAQVPPAASNGTTSLDRAAQTPAAGHLPPFVPGPPASVPPVVAGPPSSVPPAGPPAQLPPAAGAASTGIETAANTPGGQFIPPFVKGMTGR